MSEAHTDNLMQRGVSEDADPRSAALMTMLRLHWFIRLRWVFFGVALAVLTIERLLVTDVERPRALFVTLIALGAVNLCWTGWSLWLFRLYEGQRLLVCGRLCHVQILANMQVAVDLLLLTFMLRYTGGAQSPLLLFYLFHMAIVALLLDRWQALLQGAWALLLYLTLVIGECLGWFTPATGFFPWHPTGLYADPVGVVAMIGIAGCGIFGMLFFTLHIASGLERRDRELLEANAALRQSQQAIQDLQRRRSRFMQTAAHQLKSPLAVIQTLTDLIRSQIVPPEDVPATCDKIIRRCKDGILQVSELLTLARVQEADPTRHAEAQAHVQQVVTELFERFNPLATGKEIELVCRMPGDGDLHVCVEPQDLKDCVANLLENAIKYTDGPGHVWISVVPKPPTGKAEAVAISVTDTGMGIDPKLLRTVDDTPGHEPVFDAFRRGNNVIAASIPGTGLGLSIVREVVEQAGGHIRVTSRPGHGSSFTLTLPVTRRGGALSARNTRASEVVVEEGEDYPAPVPPEER